MEPQHHITQIRRGSHQETNDLKHERKQACADFLNRVMKKHHRT